MNLTELRALVRSDLGDTDSSNYRWSDEEINRHISHAVKELSEAIPHEQKAAIATTEGSRDIDVSALSGKVNICAVEYPIGKFPKVFQRFSTWGDLITLQGEEVPNGSNAYVYYGKLHTLDSASSTIPSHLEDLVAIGAEGYTAVESAIFSTNKVNTGGQTAAKDFLRWGNEKLGFFRQELKRLSRKNKVRLNQLYKPHYPQSLNSQTVIK